MATAASSTTTVPVPGAALETIPIVGRAAFSVRFLLAEFEREPKLVFTIAILIIIIFYLFYLVTRQKYRPREAPLSKKEQDDIIAEWKPVPLAPALTDRQRARRAPVVESATNTHITIGGRPHLNLSAANFLGIADDSEMKAACRRVIDKYGVGSCGPRGFYGSIDTHLELEAAIAKFMGTKDAILYSDGFQTVASAIPAFAKKGDILICDEAVNFSIQSGCLLSRATIVTFKHNDMEDLERVLAKQKQSDVERKVKEIKNRRFIVIEGIYQSMGDLAPLAKIVELRHRYKYRLIVDDTMAFGVLGKTGRGSWEHAGVAVDEIEILCAGLDATVGSTGGFCVGSTAVVDHQRLSGAGYCFSASAPPYTSTASIYAISTIEKKGPELIRVLQGKARHVRMALAGVPGIEVKGDDISPLIHIRLSRSTKDTIDADEALLQGVSDTLMNDHQIVLQVSQYVPGDIRKQLPSLKFFVTAAHTDADLDNAVAQLKAALRRALA